MKIRTLATLAAAVAIAAAPQSAHAFAGGISSGPLGPSGCNTCHTGGTAPTVAIAGPTTVTGGSSTEYTVTVSSPPGQLSAGFNAHVDVGDLGFGGSDSLLTTLVPSGMGNNDATHSGAKAGNGSEVVFSFIFDAPAGDATATLDVWGNAVNGTGTVAGDSATMASLSITVESATPVPATSPWALAGMVAMLLASGAILRRRYDLQ